jgi:hypothetical protein
VELLPKEHKAAEEKNLKATKQYDALVSVGFLNVKDTSLEKDEYFYTGKKKITVPIKTYSLTEKGKMVFQHIDRQSGFDDDGFCAAIYQVNEIKNFSQPSQAMGYTISNVNFTISPHDVSDWAKSPEIIEAFPLLAKKLEQNQLKSTTLFLMNDGWLHEKEMN